MALRSFPEPWSITDSDQERVLVDANGMRLASLNPHLMNTGILETSFTKHSARHFAKALAEKFPWPWSVIEVETARAFAVIDANSFRLVHVYFAPKQQMRSGPRLTKGEAHRVALRIVGLAEL